MSERINENRYEWQEALMEQGAKWLKECRYFFSMGKSVDGLYLYITPDKECPMEHGVHYTKEISQAQNVTDLEVAKLVAQALSYQTEFRAQVLIHEWHPAMFDRTVVLAI